jgi:hypothetical protein
MYLKTDGDVVEDPEVTREEINMLREEKAVREILERVEMTMTGEGIQSEEGE